MTETERGWYIAHRAGDDIYYLRCLKCNKSILAITTTIEECAGFIMTTDRPSSEQWRVMQKCGGCPATLYILSSDVRNETPYREPTDKIHKKNDPAAEQKLSAVKSLIDTARKWAATDRNAKKRSSRGNVLEPKFWQTLQILLTPVAQQGVCCSPQHILIQWRKIGDGSNMPNAYAAVDADLLLKYLQRAIREAKAAGIDPVVCGTEIFDDWLTDPIKFMI